LTNFIENKYLYQILLFLKKFGEANLNLANMVTTPRDMLIEALHLWIFTKGDDAEIFISRCTIYFEAFGIHKSMIKKNLRNIYKSTEKVELKSFEGRMRKAFSRPQMLIQDMDRAFNFWKNKEDVDGYEKKIDDIMEKHFQHECDKESPKTGNMGPEAELVKEVQTTTQTIGYHLKPSWLEL